MTRILTLFSSVVAAYLSAIPATHGQNFEAITTNLPALTDAEVSAADFNNDGVMDLFMSGVKAGGTVVTSIFINEGSSAYSEHSLVQLTQTSVALADYNGDNYVDVAVSGFTGSGVPKFILYRNASGSAFVQEPSLTLSIGGGGLCFTDINGNGKIDLIITGVDANGRAGTKLFEYEDGLFVTRTHRLPDVSHGSVIALDADNDFNTEVCLTGIQTDGNSIFEIHSVNTAFDSHLYCRFADGYAFSTIMVADLNHDRFADLIVSGLTGESLVASTAIFVNNKMNGFLKSASILPVLEESTIHSADINGDHYADLIISGVRDQTSPVTFLARFSDDLQIDLDSLSIDGLSRSGIAAFDSDGDTDADLLITGSTSTKVITKLFRSDLSMAGGLPPAPSIPGGIEAAVNGETVELSWVPDADFYHYNFFVRRAGEDNYLVSPGATIPDGYGKIIQQQNNLYGNHVRLLLQEGNYEWGVQAINAHGTRSPFASGTFTVCLSPVTQLVQRCNGDTVRLVPSHEVLADWNSHRQGILGQEKSEVLYTLQGTDTVTAGFAKFEGCVVHETFVVVPYANPVSEIVQQVELCEKEPMILMASAAAQWRWTDAGGTVLGEEQSLAITPTGNQPIILTLHNEHGCAATDTIAVTLLPRPIVPPVADQILCPGDSISLSIHTPYSNIRWASVTGGVLATNPVLSFTALEEDDIVLTVVDENMCSGSDTVSVRLYPLPSLEIQAQPSVCNGEDVLIKLNSNGQTLRWKRPSMQGFDSTGAQIMFPLTASESVIFHAESETGCITSDTVEIVALAPPVVNLGPDVSQCKATSVLLKAGTGLAGVEWFIGGTRSSNTDWFLQHSITDSTSIIAKVLGTNGCDATDTVAINVLHPTAFTLGDDVKACEQDGVTLRLEQSFNEFRWLADGGILLATGVDSLNLHPDRSMTIIGEMKNEWGCHSRDTVQLRVSTRPELTIPESMIICQGDSIRITGPALPCVWSKTNGQVISENNILELRPDRSETFMLSATNESGCSTTRQTAVIVYPVPAIHIDVPSSICERERVTAVADAADWLFLDWFIDDALIASGTPEIQTEIPMSSYLSLEVRDEHECVARDSVFITVNPKPVADAGEDQLICSEESATLQSDAVCDDCVFEWLPHNGVEDPLAAHTHARPSASIIYTLVVTNATGCSDSDSVWVEVNPDLVIDAGTDQSICAGETVALGGQPTAQGSRFPYEYVWWANGSPTDDRSANPVVSPAGPTKYNLWVFTGHCPVTEDSVMINVLPRPIPSVSDDVSIGAGGSTVLTASGGSSYAWLPPGSLDNPGVSSPVASPLRNTRYTVWVTDQNGCRDSASVMVYVQNILFVPNTFSPNSDGMNDTFRLYGSGIRSLTFSVFDDHGNRVYFISDPATMDREWDGSYQGELLAPGVFSWTIEGEFYNGEPISYNGKKQGIINLLK